MTAVRALLFDFGGTLDADGVAWKERFSKLVAEESQKPGAEFDRAFYDADDGLVGALPRDLGLAETVGRLAARVAQGLGRPEIAPRVASRFLAEARESLARSASLFERLGLRYRLGVVSNFYGNLESVCRETGLSPHLSAVVDSAVVGAEKPDPRIFVAALEALGAAAHETVFIGDSLARDMTGARGVGMTHIWLSPGETKACCPADRVIRRLSDLEEVLA
jgi:putative hydrolase of the HAD superfamily